MSPAKKPAARKSSAKKTASTGASRATPKRSAPKETAKKSVARKTPARKTPARKPAARTASDQGKTGRAPQATPAAKKPAAKKVAAKKASRGAARRPSGAARLDAAALATIREQLLVEREELKGREGELGEESFDSSQAEMMGEIGLDDDFADAGTATFDRERDLSIRNNILDLIEQIDHALRRLDEGTYGQCERCGRPIEAARLKALPHAVLCLDCKRREERAR
ncbi:MAG: TraR/DksA C4-type zinc finger protein [Actinobacteria bacterium]|nr:TraR/DksA C4-type zinc finger protein [Actinomycetota bacterium]